MASLYQSGSSGKPLPLAFIRFFDEENVRWIIRRVEPDVVFLAPNIARAAEQVGNAVSLAPSASDLGQGHVGDAVVGTFGIEVHGDDELVGLVRGAFQIDGDVVAVGFDELD